ncbi:hypothetical protein [Fusobacterium nucleatum]|uniref:hypothetical protein n=1 Tax=Fusobacterium nucleatum TaxID=851 RepID=UPI001EEED312|nr:hypothetical protein [Fusobacterium nucleatum]MCG6842331.1 hypothetical protein [Fusobacterium nucleatum]
MEKNINNAVFEDFMKKNEYKINFENKDRENLEIGFSKDILSKIRELLKKGGGFWTAILTIPVFFSIMYIIINSLYKISMKKKFNLPTKYFNVDLTEGLYSFSLLVFILIFLYIMKYMIEKTMDDISKIGKLLYIFYLIIQFLFIMVIYIYFYSIIKSFRIEEFWNEVFSIVFIVWTVFFFSNFLLKNKVSKGMLYFSINCLILYLIYSEDLMSIIFWLLSYFSFYIFARKDNIIDGEKYKFKTFLTILYHFIYFLYLPIYFLFSSYIIVMSEKTDYEILKINEEDKVVITTYEGNYLIADFNIFQDISTITIDTENYKLIDVVSDKIENIQYKDFKDFKYIYR